MRFKNCHECYKLTNKEINVIIIVAAALAQQWAGLAQILPGGAQVEAGWAEPPRATPHFNHWLALPMRSLSTNGHKRLSEDSESLHFLAKELQLTREESNSLPNIFLSRFLTLLSFVQCPRSDSSFWTL